MEVLYRILFVHKRPYREKRMRKEHIYLWIKDKGMKRMNSEMQIRFNRIGRAGFDALWMVLLHFWQVGFPLHYIIHYTSPRVQKQISMGLLSQRNLAKLCSNNATSPEKTLLLLRFACLSLCWGNEICKLKLTYKVNFVKGMFTKEF